MTLLLSELEAFTTEVVPVPEAAVTLTVVVVVVVFADAAATVVEAVFAKLVSVFTLSLTV